MYDAGDLINIAPLLNAGLLEARGTSAKGGGTFGPPYAASKVSLTAKGCLLVEAWRQGDEKALAVAINAQKSRRWRTNN